jgi:prepilin signal peptidase PulO-like enzyme (type II secretory pathway)
MLLGIVFVLATIYFAFIYDLSFLMVLAGFAVIFITVDIEVQKLKDRLAKLEAGTSAPIAAETEEA